MSESRRLHQELERIGLQLGFRRTKISGLEFDLYKDGVVIELAWGDGSEVWKDLCKVQVARHAGLQVHKLIILCRDYPSRSMTGYAYIKNAVEKNGTDIARCKNRTSEDGKTSRITTDHGAI